MKKYSVLIADDDEQIRYIAGRICENLGWTVDQANNGQEALALLKQRPHQIFVIDVKMPPPSGIELARYIQEHEEAPAILILTGHADVDQVVQAMKEGLIDYIQKDQTDLDRLEAVLKRAADYHENRLTAIYSQKQREQEIHNIEEANREFQIILELSNDIIFILDVRTGRFKDTNSSSSRLLHYSRKEFMPLSYRDIDARMTVPEWESLIDELRSKETHFAERLFRTKEGIEIPVEISFSYACLQTGEYLACIARDITERKRIQEAIQEQTDILYNITSSAKEAIIMIDSEGLINFWNPAAERIFAYSHQEIIGKELHSLIAQPHDFQSYKEKFQYFQQTGEGPAIGKTLELTAVKKDGTVFPIELSLSSVLIKGKWNAIGILRDITERKQNEEIIKKARLLAETHASKLRTMIDTMEEGVVFANKDDSITEVNEWFIHLAHTPREFLIGQPLDKIIHLVSGCTINRILEGYKTGEYSEKSTLQSSISNMNVMLSLQPIFRMDLYDGIILNVVDVTTIVSSQEKAAQDHRTQADYFLEICANMRTPLEGMKSLLDQTLNSDLSEEQRILLEMVKECGNTVENLLQVVIPNPK